MQMEESESLLTQQSPHHDAASSLESACQAIELKESEKSLFELWEESIQKYYSMKTSLDGYL